MSYLAISLVDFGHLNDLGPSHVAGPGGADQIIQVWWLGWAEHALAHGENPFFSSWINYPVGINSGPNGSMLALGVLFSPVTAVFNPVVTWNVLVRLTLCISALSMCLVLRRWTRWWPAAFVGGLLYGFCAYQTTQAAGYVFLTFAPLPPVFFFLLYEGLVRQRWRPSRAGILLGVVIAAEFLVSSEICASTLLFALIAVVFYAIADWSGFRSRWVYTKAFLTWSVLAGVVLLAGPVAFALFGSQATHGVPNASVKNFDSDLLGGILPGRFQRFGVSWTKDLGLQNMLPSPDTYFGLPFLVSVVGIVIWLRTRGIVLLTGVLAATSYLLSLGSTLYVDGHDTHVPLPYFVLAHLPLVQGLDPPRLSLFTALFGGAVVSFGLDEAYRRWCAASGSRAPALRTQRRIGIAVLAALALVVVLPLTPANAQPLVRARYSSLFTSGAVANQIPPGSTVLTYPYPDSPVFPGAFGYSFSARYQDINLPLLDQAVAGIPFRLIGSYGWRPNGGTANTAGPSSLEPESVKAFFDFEFYGVTTTPGQAGLLVGKPLVADLRDFLHVHRVAAAVVLPVGQHSETVGRFLTAAIGAPSHVDGAEVWFDVQHRLKTSSPGSAPTFVVPPPVTRVTRPTSGDQLHGIQFLDAEATSSFGLRSVEFHIAGEGRDLAEKAVPSEYGWLGGWNTTTVPNGTYTVRCVVTDVTGQVSTSAGVVVHVTNRAP